MFKKELPSLSLINAEAQHEFWKRDLGFAEQYLKYVYTFQGRNLPNYDKILSIAERDVEEYVCDDHQYRHPNCSNGR